MNKYLCGIDVGTTGTKVMIFDLHGNAISSAYQEYGCIYPNPNWVEQDIEMVLSKTFETCNWAILKGNVNPSDIASISLSTQRATSIFLDENEKVLKTISWQDNRASKEMADISQKIDPSLYYEKTGLALSTTWIITKILWVRNNEPKIWDKVCKVVQVQDFFLRNLGADSYYVDYPDACLFGCFDSEKNVWDKELLELCEIDEALLPIPTPCATRIGVVSENASLKTGFKAGTPICVGAGDQNSASVGAGVIKKGMVSVSLGTGGMAIAYLDKPYRDPKASVCVISHPINGAYQFEGYQIAAASVFKWFKDEIAGIESAYAKSVNKNVYALLDEQIKDVPVGSNGLLLMPYFGSSASPKWNPNARGVLLGLTLAHNRACVARAFMEGITLEQKDIITNMQNNEIEINSIRIMGGATKSEIWNQMQADMYDLTCETLAITDAAILGAAIMAGVAIGEFKSIEQAVNSMVKIDKKYEPNKNNVKIYDELFDIYCETYKGLTENNVYDKISKFQELHK